MNGFLKKLAKYDGNYFLKKIFAHSDKEEQKKEDDQYQELDADIMDFLERADEDEDQEDMSGTGDLDENDKDSIVRGPKVMNFSALSPEEFKEHSDRSARARERDKRRDKEDLESVWKGYKSGVMGGFKKSIFLSNLPAFT